MATTESYEEGGNENSKRGLEKVITILYIQGFWYDEDQESDLQHYLKYFSLHTAKLFVRHRFLRQALRCVRRFSPWILMIFSFLQTFVIQPMDLFLFWDVKMNVIEDAYALLLLGFIHISMACVLFQKKTCRDIVRELQTIAKDFHLEEDEIQKMLNRIYNICHILTNGLYYVGIGFSVLEAFYTFEFLLPARKFGTRGWYPYNEYASPAFEITLIVWLINLNLLFMVGNMFTALTMVVFLYLNEYFKILSYKLLNIKQRSIDKIKERKQKEMMAAGGENVRRHFENTLNVSGFHNTQTGRLGTFNPASLQTTRSLTPVFEQGHPWTGDNESEIYNPQSRDQCASRTTVHRHHSNSTIHSIDVERGELVIEEVEESFEEEVEEEEDNSYTQKELDEEMNREFADLVKLHQKLLRLTTAWGAFWEFHYIYLYVLSIVLFALTVIQITSVEHLGLKELLLFIISGQLIELYFVSNFLPNLITTQAAAVGEAVYSCDWLDASPSFKRSMLIFMSRTNVPLLITPTGLDPLSLKTFAEVSNIAYKMLATTSSMVGK